MTTLLALALLAEPDMAMYLWKEGQTPGEATVSLLVATPETGFTVIRHPEWSPVGPYVALMAHKQNQRPGKVLFLTDTTTGQTRRLAAGGMPSWLPDGSGLVFMTWQERYGNNLITIESGEITRLSDPSNLVVSRDGTYMLSYASEYSPDSIELVSLPDGGTTRTLAMPEGWELTQRPEPIIEDTFVATGRFGGVLTLTKLTLDAQRRSFTAEPILDKPPEWTRMTRPMAARQTGDLFLVTHRDDTASPGGGEASKLRAIHRSKGGDPDKLERLIAAPSGVELGDFCPSPDGRSMVFTSNLFYLTPQNGQFLEAEDLLPD